MKIGDRLEKVPTIRCYEHEKGGDRRVPCEVVYIHPEKRFYTVRYKFMHGGPTYRESFAFPVPSDLNYMPDRIKFPNEKERKTV